MLSKALNLITLQYFKLTFFSKTIISCSWLMWRAIICTVSYDKKHFILCVINSRWCNLGYKMVCQTLSYSVVTVLRKHCWCCFPTRPAVCAVHVTHLSWRFRLNIQSPPPQGYFSHICLSDTPPASFSMWNLKCMIRESETLDLHYANVKGQVK